jgi:23S rRNA (cytidine1920-2'-O)/16S rRNA (cytidine1409-2'-O)-methyltransferase
MEKVPLLELLKLRFPEKNERELFAAVLRGDVGVNGRRILKPGTRVPREAEIDLRSEPRFVSRGGEKLDHALRAWRHVVAGKILLDAGCSTGGFTDCLLRNGASRVYSIDVGFNTLDWRIRCDPRVVPMERTNVMALSASDFSPRPHQAVADLSFRSLRRAAAHILDLTEERRGIFLVKPQFEWRDPPPSFRGIVEDTDRLREILIALLQEFHEEGVFPSRGIGSPILGRKGNREFLLLLARTGERTEEGIHELVERLVGE